LKFSQSLAGALKRRIDLRSKQDQPGADEVKRAVRVSERFVAFNAELFELVEEQKGWEKENPSLDNNRGEPWLRVREALRVRAPFDAEALADGVFRRMTGR
jgi:hypothetical protein